MQSIESILKDHGFSTPFQVEGRASVANLFSRGERCGIYILHFVNGEYYIGQSIDMVRRYADHRKKHTDIQKISFKCVPSVGLNDEEKRLILLLENKCDLRNVDLTSFHYGDSDFDQIMSLDEQQNWLQDLDLVDLKGDRVIDPDLRRKHKAKFKKLLVQPSADEIIEVLRAYVQASIPTIKLGEVSFWEISCFPGDAQWPSARINVSWQLVFDVIDNSPFPPVFVWYITKSLTEEAFGITLSNNVDVETLYLPFDDGYNLEFDIRPSSLKKGGQNQIKIIVNGSENALRLIRDTKFASAIRNFNLNLIKRGPCPWGESHCLDLADKLIEPNEDIDAEIAALQDGYGQEILSYRFWNQFLERAKKRTKVFKEVSLSPMPRGYNRHIDRDLTIDSLLIDTNNKDAVISLDLGQEITRIALRIGSDPDGDDKRIRTIFNTLLSSKQSIEKSFGEPLEWNLDQSEPCEFAMIYKEIEIGGYANEDVWDTLQDTLLDNFIRLERVFNPYLSRLHVS